MHGQSEYTPTKQKHLMGLLKMLTHALDPRVNGKPGWAHEDILCADCTAGNGHAENGDLGSPLIINEWASRSYGFNFQQLCCERMPTSYVRLASNNLPQTSMALGAYQDKAREWLESINVTKPALGFVYCDPNGVKDLLEGMDFFQWVASEPRYNRMDFIFHWSLTAYQRSFGNNFVWANDSLFEIIETLRSLKRNVIMREPIDVHRWVIMYLNNSDKVDGRWRKEGFITADEWVDRFLRAKGQRPLLGDDVLAELTV